MADLMDLIRNQLDDRAMDMISQQIGANRREASDAVVSALPVILQAMNRNASQPKGAASLYEALARDHQGDLLDNLAGFIGNAQQGPGAGILRHVLGSRRNGVEEMVSKTSGLDKQSTAKLLEILAPIVMAQLGRQRQRGGLDIGSLVQMLGTTTRHQQQAHPRSTSLVNQLLDSDGDGNIQDDVVNMGLNAIVGGFFRNRK